MKTKYKYIHFADVTDKIWACCNNKSGGVIGLIEPYSTWKVYIFKPCGDTVFSADCLDDISHFIGQLK